MADFDGAAAKVAHGHVIWGRLTAAGAEVHWRPDADDQAYAATLDAGVGAPPPRARYAPACCGKDSESPPRGLNY